MRFGTLVHATALALLPAVAGAQPLPGVTAPTIDRGVVPADPGVELGVGSTIVLMFPTIGGHVSLPTRTGLRVEVGSQFLPWLLEDGDDLGVMTHVQLRIPVRSGPPGSRRGWLAGVTAFTIGNRWDEPGTWSFDTIVRPNVGFSWQWQTTAHLDVRFDIQGVITGTNVPLVAPFATFSLVWHRDRRLS
jgi:hypothetical protein